MSAAAKVIKVAGNIASRPRKAVLSLVRLKFELRLFVLAMKTYLYSFINQTRLLSLITNHHFNCF